MCCIMLYKAEIISALGRRGWERHREAQLRNLILSWNWKVEILWTWFILFYYLSIYFRECSSGLAPLPRPLCHTHTYLVGSPPLSLLHLLTVTASFPGSHPPMLPLSIYWCLKSPVATVILWELGWHSEESCLCQLTTLPSDKIPSCIKQTFCDWR